MAVTVRIPTPLQKLTQNMADVAVEAGTIHEVVASLEAKYPGIKERLCDGDNLRPGLAVVIDNQVSRAGLWQPVSAESEIHFVPAIAGGANPGR